MNPTRLLVIALIAAALPLTACKKKPEVPPPSLPRVERPMLTLHVKADELAKLLIPRQALAERGGMPGVFVLQETGVQPPATQARFRLVRTGRVRDGQVEILSGLRGDETLVLGDLTAVHDGSPITAVSSNK
jgi:hypothetical protein